MKLTSIFLIFSFSAGSLWAQPLENFVQTAIENNPGIRAKRIEYEAALRRLPQVKALPEPVLNASYFIRPMMLPMGNQLGSVSFMQMFPWFGTLSAMEHEAARMAEVKLQAVVIAQNELAFKLKNAWFPLLELEENISIQKDLLRVLETDKALAVANFEQGRAPMTDALRVDIMLDEANTKITLLELQRKPLLVAFNKLLDLPGDAPIAVEEYLPAPLPLPLQPTIDGGNPFIVIFDKQIQATAAEQAVAEYMRKPMIGAGFQYMPMVKRKGHDVHIEPNTGQDMFMPMFSLTIPVWRKKYDAASEERHLMQLALADMKRDTENELVAMLEMTIYELSKTRQMIDLLDGQSAKTQQIIDLMLAAYTQAGRDFDEILRLQQQLFNYRSEKTSLKAAYQAALAKLDYLNGKIY